MLLPWLLVMACPLDATPARLQAPSPRPPVPAELQARIQRAIDRGVDGLLRRQELDGSWRDHQPRFLTGMTALAVYTLRHCGLPADHPSIRRALAWLETMPAEDTYSQACQVLALASLQDPRAKERIRDLAAAILDGQQLGGWSYPVGDPDLSNTQYAALGLWTAARAGVRIPAKVWVDLGRFTLRSQERVRERAVTGRLAPAGFRYRPDTPPTGSMTVAGVTILAICDRMLGGREQAFAAGRDRGLAWLAAHWSVRDNPIPSQGRPAPDLPPDGRLFYYLYGLERVAALLELQEIGGHNWYAAGAEVLLPEQEEDGLWPGRQSETCFALLFLARATGRAVTGEAAVQRSSRSWGRDDPGADVSLRAAGEGTVTLWIGAIGARARQALEWEGEEGQGLRIEKVEYLEIPPPPESGPPVLLARVDGDPARPHGRERFAVRHVFPRPGRHRVFAVITGLLPGAEAGEELSRFLLQSGMVEIPVAYAQGPELLGYARDPGRNRLAGVAVTASASSEWNPSWPAAAAADNLQGTAWYCAPDDPAPWLRLDLPRRGVRARRLLLSVARSTYAGWTGRPAVVEVLLNGAREGEVLELDPDPWRKTVLELPRTKAIRRIEVHIRQREGGQVAGFAEVELQGGR